VSAIQAYSEERTGTREYRAGDAEPRDAVAEMWIAHIIDHEDRLDGRCKDGLLHREARMDLLHKDAGLR